MTKMTTNDFKAKHSADFNKGETITSQKMTSLIDDLSELYNDNPTGSYSDSIIYELQTDITYPEDDVTISVTLKNKSVPSTTITLAITSAMVDQITKKSTIVAIAPGVIVVKKGTLFALHNDVLDNQKYSLTSVTSNMSFKGSLDKSKQTIDANGDTSGWVFTATDLYINDVVQSSKKYYNSIKIAPTDAEYRRGLQYSQYYPKTRVTHYVGDTGWLQIPTVSLKPGCFVKARRINNKVTLWLGGGIYDTLEVKGFTNGGQRQAANNMFIVENDKMPVGFRSPNSLTGLLTQSGPASVGTWYLGGDADKHHLRLQFINTPNTDQGYLRVSQIEYITDDPWPTTF